MKVEQTKRKLAALKIPFRERLKPFGPCLAQQLSDFCSSARLRTIIAREDPACRSDPVDSRFGYLFGSGQQFNLPLTISTLRLCRPLQSPFAIEEQDSRETLVARIGQTLGAAIYEIGRASCRERVCQYV